MLRRRWAGGGVLLADGRWVRVAVVSKSQLRLERRRLAARGRVRLPIRVVVFQ